MSDDTPTQRYPEGFPPPGGAPQPTPPTPSGFEAPTERFAAPGAVPQPAVVPPGAVPPRTPAGSGDSGNRKLIIALAVIGGVLLLIIIGLLIWIGVSSGSPAPVETPSDTPSAETPTPEPSESETPTPEPSETTPPPPPPPANIITSYTASTQTVDCSGGGPVPVTFSWATSASTVWFGVGTDDAKAAPYDSFPGNYTLTDFPYQCGQPTGQQIYTITAERSDGATKSQTITIRET